ncbi:MAG TPA: hypothetical protein VNZ94_01715 [Xanthobacteraceae bacterium]|nr:hypothetical protein [Xanthobacteraceae bacterium]
MSSGEITKLEMEVRRLSEIIGAMGKVLETHLEEMKPVGQGIKNAHFASAATVAAVVIALEKRGALDRKDAIREIDGLTSRLHPTDPEAPTVLYGNLVNQILRREAEGGHTIGRGLPSNF